MPGQSDRRECPATIWIASAILAGRSRLPRSELRTRADAAALQKYRARSARVLVSPALSDKRWAGWRGGRVLPGRPRVRGNWSTREYSLVAERPWVARWQKTTNNRQELASLSNDVALLVEQFERVKPGTKASRPHHQHELAVLLRQPGADRVVDDGPDQFTAAPGKSGGSVRCNVRAAGS
jgi:alpha-beta hydrolase superfamily lysophospholipase